MTDDLVARARNRIEDPLDCSVCALWRKDPRRRDEKTGHLHGCMYILITELTDALGEARRNETGPDGWPRHLCDECRQRCYELPLCGDCGDCEDRCADD